MPEDWRSAVTFPLCRGKGEKTKNKNYSSISLLSVVGKIYTAGSLIDDYQGGFRVGRGCVDQIFN